MTVLATRRQALAAAGGSVLYPKPKRKEPTVSGVSRTIEFPAGYTWPQSVNPPADYQPWPLAAGTPFYVETTPMPWQARSAVRLLDLLLDVWLSQPNGTTLTQVTAHLILNGQLVKVTPAYPKSSQQAQPGFIDYVADFGFEPPGLDVDLSEDRLVFGMSGVLGGGAGPLFFVIKGGGSGPTGNFPPSRFTLVGDEQ